MHKLFLSLLFNDFLLSVFRDWVMRLFKYLKNKFHINQLVLEDKWQFLKIAWFLGGKNVTNRPYLLFQSNFGTYRILKDVFAIIIDITWNILLCLLVSGQDQISLSKPVFLIISVLDTVEGNVHIYIYYKSYYILYIIYI